jgi:hypothetical protein
MSQLRLDPTRQLLGAQCSGTLILAKLGLLDGVPACTDLTTKPWVEEAGVAVLNQPFVARGNVATAGGCLSSQYLAAWFIARLEGVEAARSATLCRPGGGEGDLRDARDGEHFAVPLRGTDRLLTTAATRSRLPRAA